MAEQAYVRVGDGSVMVHDVPLPSGIADRIERGDLALVNADGSPMSNRAASKQKVSKVASTED